MPDSVITSCSTKPPTETAHHSITTRSSHLHHDHRYSQSNSDEGGSQSDSSNSNSSLVSSPRFNERHPKVFESVRKKSSGRVCYGNSGCSASVTGVGVNSSHRGSFVMLSSRTSLPPVDENNPLDATESQLAFNLRRATTSSSWTNQKILDAIDGLHTCAKELDPCLAVVEKALSIEEKIADGTSKNEESPRQASFEKFSVPKSISNLIMKSRSSGSVNPAISNQNRENSCYNFLSKIREDEDEEQQPLPQDIFASSGTHTSPPVGVCSRGCSSARESSDGRIKSGAILSHPAAAGKRGLTTAEMKLKQVDNTNN